MNMKDRLLELDGMLRKNPRATTKDFIDEIQDFWTEFGLLLSKASATASITLLEQVSPAQEAIKYITPWDQLSKMIASYIEKLNTVLSNGLIDQVYERTERLFLLSDEREHSITCFKGLVNDLKHTEKSFDRFIKLENVIIELFNSFNILLQITGRTLTSAGLEINTFVSNFSEITKKEIGL